MTTCLLILCLVAEPQASFSVLPNGSFEEQLDGRPTHWKVHLKPQAGGDATFVFDTAEKQHGSQSARLRVVGPASVYLDSEPFDVTPNARYLFSLRYRGEGLSDGSGHQGVNAYAYVYWFDGNGTRVGRDGAGAPYRSHPWDHMLRIVTAPTNAVRAIVHFGAGAGKDTLPTTVWLDDARFRPWITRPKANPRKWQWSIAAARKHFAGFRVVVDEDTTWGRSVAANLRHHSTGHYPCGGFYRRDIPHGVHRVEFRLKVATNTAPKRCAALDVNTSTHVNSTPVGRTLHATEFAAPMHYQVFPLSFIRPQKGWVDFRVLWHGVTSLWVDTVTVIEEELNDAEKFDDVLAR